jgi:hypothetical protein
MRMTTMAECPFCKVKVGANDFLPSKEAACSVCGNRLLSSPPSLPPSMTPAAPKRKRPYLIQPTPSPSTVSPEPNKPETVPTVADPPPPQIAPGEPWIAPLDESAEDEEPPSLLDRLRTRVDIGSALAFFCFSLALLCVSLGKLAFFTKPVAALGLAAGLLGGVWPALQRGKDVRLPLLLSFLCLLALLFLGRWTSSSFSPPPLVRIALQQKRMAAHEAIREDDWMDASAYAVKRQDVRLEIVSAQVGPAELNPKPLPRSPLAAEPYLTIRLRASYEGVVFRQTPYEPWADLPGSPSKHAPTLTDNQGRAYAQKTFDPGCKVVGRADFDALNPGHQVKEVLIYPVPSKDVEHLQLLLPASAFGLTGAFRFQVPRSMIRGLE